MQVVDVIDIIDVTDVLDVTEVTVSAEDAGIAGGYSEPGEPSEAIAARRRPVLPPTSPANAATPLRSPVDAHGSARRTTTVLATAGMLLSALLLLAALAGNALVLLFKVPASPWLAGLVEAGPVLALLLGALATLAGYASAQRHAQQHARPLNPQGVGAPVWQLATATALLVASVAVSVLTLAPAPLHVLGTSLATTSAASAAPSGNTSNQPGTAPVVAPTPTATATPLPTPSPTPVPHLAVAFGPTALHQTCSSFYAALPPVQLTLDNTASNVDAQYQVQDIQLIPGTPHPWASTAQSGVAPAGQSITLTFTPHPKLCYWNPLPGKIYHLTVSVNGGPSAAVADTIMSPQL